MRKYTLFLFGLSLVLVGGCDFLNLPDNGDTPAVDINTDQRVYSFSDSTNIQLIFANQSADTLYYNYCMTKTLEEMRDGEVLNALPFPVCLCKCPRNLVPGEQDTLFAGIDFIEQHRDSLELAGDMRYRFRLGGFYRNNVFLNDGPADPVSEEALLSNRFRLETN